MMRCAARTISLILAGVLMASPVLAQPAPSPRQIELAHRYIAAVHMDRTVDATMKAMLPGMLASLPKGDAIQAERQQVTVEVVSEVTRNMMSKMVVRMEPIIAETFTEKELEGLVNFYEGPIGQSLIAKSPQIAAKLTPLMKDLVPEMQGEIAAKLCMRIACTATPKVAPTEHPS
jgi:hypothetical protein